MKIGNVAFLCIRLHGATTSVSMCVWGRGKGLSPACGMPPSSHAQKMLLSVQWSIFYATLQQTEPQMNHMHTHTHTHIFRSKNIHIHTYIYIQMYMQTETFIELQSGGNNDTDNESCSNMCPLWMQHRCYCCAGSNNDEISLRAHQGVARLSKYAVPAANKRTSN